MKQVLLVFIGGGIGSVLRFLISKVLNPTFQYFFLGTFLVNIIGCLLIGIVLGFSEKNNFLSENYTLLLATGLCGGFTTFSTFAFEKYSLIKSGDLLQLAIYLISTITIGILAVVFGLWLTKQ